MLRKNQVVHVGPKGMETRGPRWSCALLRGSWVITTDRKKTDFWDRKKLNDSKLFQPPFVNS